MPVGLIPVAVWCSRGVFRRIFQLMTLPYDLSRLYYPYVSDTGPTFDILSDGDTGAVNDTIGYQFLAHSRIPRNIRPRYALGVSSTGARSKVIVLDPSSTIWTGAVPSFLKAAVSFKVMALIGERVLQRG